MDETLTPFEALKQAVESAGSQSALARICGVTQTAVWKWLQSGKRLPAEYVLKAEAATGVSRHALRPDIYPPEIETNTAPGEACAPILSDSPAPVSCGPRAIPQRSNGG